MLPQDVSIVVLFDDSQGDHLLNRLLPIGHLVSGRAGCEVVVVGHGHAEVSSAIARSAVAALPNLRVLLHSSPCRAGEALVAGVEFARTRWVVLLGKRHDPATETAQIAALLAAPDAALPPDAGSADRPVCVERDRFLALPRIRAMQSFLPELLAMNPGESRSPAGRGTARNPLIRWLRMRWVTALCRLAGPPPMAPPGAGS